ncbi:MAG: hypothetical protein BWY97_01539 [Tenericutes bacterium ADurb.BinA124]|nr:MAG: hypothetical protein BWY97_01539 [Tenericutes bacterium ADurb.BinA124]
MTGYRRKGKNIITGKTIIEAPNLSSGLILNNNRAKQLELLMRLYYPVIIRAYLVSERTYRLDWNHHWQTCGAFLDTNEPYLLSNFQVPNDLDLYLMHTTTQLLKATKQIRFRAFRFAQTALRYKYNYLATTATWSPGGLYQPSSNNFSYVNPNSLVSYNGYTVSKPKAIGFTGKKITAPKHIIQSLSIYGE